MITAATTTLSPGETVIWDEIRVNEGGYFVPGSGEFVCPDEGLYYFSVSAATPRNLFNLYNLFTFVKLHHKLKAFHLFY